MNLGPEIGAGLIQIAYGVHPLTINGKAPYSQYAQQHPCRLERSRRVNFYVPVPRPAIKGGS